MAYIIGSKKSLAAGKVRVSDKDIYCYLDVDYFDDNFCTYKGRTFEKGIAQPLRKFVFNNISGFIFIENAYYAHGRLTDCNAEFIIPAGTKYYYSSLYIDYIAETIIFNGYLTSGWRKALARIG
jgi:hypothetical protein